MSAHVQISAHKPEPAAAARCASQSELAAVEAALSAKLNAISRQYPGGWNGASSCVEQEQSRRSLWQTYTALESGIRKGLFPGAQLYASLRAKPVASVALGYARHGVEMTPSTLLPWFCNVKPLIATAFAKLWEQGKLAIDDRVVNVIPEFGRYGKDAITFRHILAHTAGLKRDPIRPIRFEPRDRVLDVIYQTSATPGNAPGFAAKYSVFWGWCIICETIRRISGRDYERYLEEFLIRPLELHDFWPQMSAQQVSDRLERFGLLYGLDRSEPYPWPTKSRLDHYDRDQPSTSLIATAKSVCCAYEGILQNRLLSPTTTAALTAKHRVGLYDENFRGFVSFGLGMVVDGDYFGSYCSPRTYGHKGINSSCVIVDPEYELVLAFIVNGLISTEVSDARDRHIIDCVYRDLGLGEGRPAAPRITRVDQCRTVKSKPEMPGRTKDDLS